MHWFKWEAYTTWLSGFALFVVVYYAHATAFLIDPSVADLTAWEAIALSVGGIVARLVRLRRPLPCIRARRALLAVLVFAFICAAAWASWNLFAAAGRLPPGRRDDRDDDGRERLLRDHPGALGADPREGGRARARPALERRAARQRSVHNNYLTLPVVFAMLSNHFTFTYGHHNGWIVLVALMAIGALRSPLLQPAPSRPERLADSRDRGSGNRGHRHRDPLEARVSDVLEIIAAGMRFVARWEEEAAPRTVAAFKASLPLDDRIIHCRWSGESNWIPWGDRDFGIGPENATSYPHPGELALYPGGQSETELLFPYGYCSFASKAGHLWANHFATVVEGQEQLRELGRLTLWEGAQKISFRDT